VAIEPSSGEILCYVSSPTYDPNLMVGRERGNNAAKLYQDPYKPFFIRPIQAYYPPGSSFKPLSALIALQEGIITPQTTYYCPGSYQPGHGKPKCTHAHGLVNLSSAIAGSCNGYFAMVFEKLMNYHGARNTSATFTDWRQNVTKFGFGVKLDVDIPNEGRGNVPTALHYDNVYKTGNWRSSTILSLAIGQGELEATPLQLANIECTIANHGFYYKPHLIKGIGDKDIIKPEYTVKNNVGIDPQYFEPVIEGMQNVVEGGGGYATARRSKIPGIIMCGKTGTAQNPHGKNHSVFVAFAPRENPKIAIAVIVENSGDGGDYAAPIASFIVEKYLRGEITKRESGITPEEFTNMNRLPDLSNYIHDKKPSKKDSLKKTDTDTSKKQVVLKTVSNKNKQRNPVNLLANREAGK
jgi:penicillin-binding protein 2